MRLVTASAEIQSGTHLAVRSPKKAGDRPASAGALTEELRRAVEGGKGLAENVRSAEKTFLATDQPPLAPGCPTIRRRLDAILLPGSTVRNQA